MFIVVSLIVLTVAFLMVAVLLREIELQSAPVVALDRTVTPVQQRLPHEARVQFGINNLSPGKPAGCRTRHDEITRRDFPQNKYLFL